MKKTASIQFQPFNETLDLQDKAGYNSPDLDLIQVVQVLTYQVLLLLILVLQVQ